MQLHSDRVRTDAHGGRWEVPAGISLATGAGTIEPAWPENPRGLLSLGAPVGERGQQVLLNYIAAEPMVRGRRGYSELEHGPDGMPGLRWHVRRVDTSNAALTIDFELDRFANGAAIAVRAEVTVDRPREVRLQPSELPGSAPVDSCDLSATMGNYAKLRRVRLGERVLRIDELRLNFMPNGFTPDMLFELPPSGVAVAIPDEAPAPDTTSPEGWRYRGRRRVAQYWRTDGPPPPGAQIRLNARRTYWATRAPIPGGPAFENFELRLGARQAPVVFGFEVL